MFMAKPDNKLSVEVGGRGGAGGGGREIREGGVSIIVLGWHIYYKCMGTWIVGKYLLFD